MSRNPLSSAGSFGGMLVYDDAPPTLDRPEPMSLLTAGGDAKLRKEIFDYANLTARAATTGYRVVSAGDLRTDLGTVYNTIPQTDPHIPDSATQIETDMGGDFGENWFTGRDPYSDTRTNSGAKNTAVYNPANVLGGDVGHNEQPTTGDGRVANVANYAQPPVVVGADIPPDGAVMLASAAGKATGWILAALVVVAVVMVLK